MIEQIKNIKECLVLSNKATTSLNSILKHMQDKFLDYWMVVLVTSFFAKNCD